MKIKLLIIALLAGIAGYGQATYSQPQSAKQQKQLDDQWNAFVAQQPTVVVLERRLDSLIRIVGLMHDSITELYNRPFLQLEQWPGEIWPRGGIQIDSVYWQWPHLDTLPLIWDSASLRRYILPSGTAVPYTGSIGFVRGDFVDSLFATNSAVRFQTTPKKKKKK